MTFDQLEMFIQVAESKSISAAAARSYLSKQAISLQIMQLEAETGCRLMDRGHSGITLTVAGEEFLRGARQLTRERNQLIGSCLELSGENKIRLGNVEHQVLLDVVTREFHHIHPEIEIVRVAHLNHSGEWRVSNDVMDVAESFQVNDGKPFFPHLQFEKLTELPYQIAMRKGHPLSSRSVLSLSDLPAYRLTLFPMMINAEYVNSVEEAFADAAKNLLERRDNDHQTEAAFTLVDSNDLLLCANPFFKTIESLTLVPLDTGWKRIYGLVYRPPMKFVVRKYLETARQVFGQQ